MKTKANKKKIIMWVLRDEDFDIVEYLKYKANVTNYLKRLVREDFIKDSSK